MGTVPKQADRPHGWCPDVSVMLPFFGASRHQPVPDPCQAPAAVAAKDVVPMYEAARQVPPRDPRTQEVVDPVQEAAALGMRTHLDRGILLQQTEENIEFDSAQRVTGHGKGVVNKSVTWKG